MTLVKVKVNFPELTDAVKKAISRGVDKAVVEMGNEMQEMLAKPGRGRVYVRKSGKKYSKTALRAMKRAHVRGIKGRHFQYIKRIGLANVLRQLRKDGRRNPKTIRSLGFHKASAPGAPPARDTGHLARSWQVGFSRRGTVERQGNVYRLVVGSNLNYAKWLEFGTKNMAERPYVRPVAEIMRRRAPLIIQAEVANAIAKRNRGGK